jgi:hypothetical protein
MDRTGKKGADAVDKRCREKPYAKGKFATGADADENAKTGS